MPRVTAPLYPNCPGAALEAARLGVPLRPVTWASWDALWAVLASILLAGLVGAAAMASGLDPDGGWVVATVAASWLGLAGWPLLAARRRGNGIVVDLGWSLSRSDLLAGLAGGAAAFAAAIATAALTQPLFGEVGSAAGEQAQALAESSSPGVLVLFALMVLLGAPIAEELTFRGLLWSGVARRTGRAWVAILVSASAFALVHFEPHRLPLLLAVGTVLGLVRWRTRSLGACIVAHGCNNAPGAVGILALALGQ